MVHFACSFRKRMLVEALQSKTICSILIHVSLSSSGNPNVHLNNSFFVGNPCGIGLSNRLFLFFQIYSWSLQWFEGMTLQSLRLKTYHNKSKWWSELQINSRETAFASTLGFYQNTISTSLFWRYVMKCTKNGIKQVQATSCETSTSAEHRAPFMQSAIKGYFGMSQSAVSSPWQPWRGQCTNRRKGARE